MRRALLTLLATAAAAGVAAGPAAAQDPVKAGSKTATAGAVSATLSWGDSEFGYGNLKMTIARNGTVLEDKPVFTNACGEGYCRIDVSEPLELRDLDADGEPEVLASVFTGGAHCCVILTIWGLKPDGSGYARRTLNTLSAGYGIKDRDGDGIPEIETADPRFEDLFSSHAGSFPPPLELHYSRATNRLTDVTRRFPSVIRPHAAEALKLLRKAKRDEIDWGGIVSGYVADQYLLGRGKVGLAEVDRATKRGLLGTRREAKAFRTRLLRLLKQYGYR